MSYSFAPSKAEALRRRGGRRRLLVSLLPAVVFVILASARSFAHRERAVAEEDSAARRRIMYSLVPGESLDIPVVGGTEAIRVVAYAFSRGVLLPHAHRSIVSTRTIGDQPNAEATLNVLAPGTQGRAAAEESGLTVADPVAFNVDLTGSKASGLRLTLDSISEAEGLLVRIYRRQLSADRDTADIASIDAASEHSARRAGVVDWVDLDASDRLSLGLERWRRVAPIPADGHPLTPVVIAISPPIPKVSSALQEVSRARLGLTEHLWAGISGPNHLIVKAAAEDPVTLSVTLRSVDQQEQTLRGVGTLEISVDDGHFLELNASADRKATLSLEASNPHGVKLAAKTAYDRATPAHPVIVQAGDQPIVLRVEGRRPMTRDDPERITVAFVAEIRGTTEWQSTITADVGRAQDDRYDPSEDDRQPSERVTSHLLIPAGACARLRPSAGEVDLSLFELDPRAEPRPWHSRSVTDEAEGTRTHEPPAFVSRLPTNESDFVGAAHGSLRVVPGRRASERPVLPIVHVHRPMRGLTQHRDGRLFTTVSERFIVEVAGRPAALPVRLIASTPTHVVVSVDGESPRRRKTGVATTVTFPHALTVDAETQMTLLLGDDLEPGRHTVSFDADGPVLVHLPWKRTGPQAKVAWVSGGFEP